MTTLLDEGATAQNRERILVAHRDGGVCPLCTCSLAAGDALWPLTATPRQLFAHRACAARDAQCAPADLVPPACKHWSKRGACQFGADCFFTHCPREGGASVASCKNSAAPATEANAAVAAASAAAPAAAWGKAAAKAGRYAVRKRRPVANDSRAFAFRAFLIDTFGLDLLASGRLVVDASPRLLGDCVGGCLYGKAV